MEDKAPSAAAEALFALLANLAGLRHHPEAIAKLTPDDQEWLDSALKDYKINALNLAEKFIEPLRLDNAALAEDVYDLIRRLMHTSAVIGATLIFSNSTIAFLRPSFIVEKDHAQGATARGGKDKLPHKVALKNAIRKFRYRVQPGTHYRQASQMHDWVNEELNKEGHDSVDIRKIERMLKNIILSD